MVAAGAAIGTTTASSSLWLVQRLLEQRLLGKQLVPPAGLGAVGWGLGAMTSGWGYGTVLQPLLCPASGDYGGAL